MKFKNLKFGKNKNEVDEAAFDEEPEAVIAPEPAAADIPLEAAPPAPHGPMAELTVDAPPAIVDSDEPVDFGGLEMPVTPDDDDDEDITVVEVKAGEAAEAKGEAVVPAAEGAAEEEGDPAEVSLEDSISSLFSDDEEEANPLKNLIDSLPEVTVQELMDDIQEIKEIMQEWRQH